MCQKIILSLLILLVVLAAPADYSQGWDRADFGSPYVNRLYWSIEDDNVEVVKEYLQAGWPIEEKSGLLKNSILSYAASVGSVKVVKFLILKGADVNSRCHNELTPLMNSIPAAGVNFEYNRKKLEVFKILLHNPKVDLNARNRGGKTILDMAGILGQKEIAALIREEIKKRRS